MSISKYYNYTNKQKNENVLNFSFECRRDNLTSLNSIVDDLKNRDNSLESMYDICSSDIEKNLQYNEMSIERFIPIYNRSIIRENSDKETSKFFNKLSKNRVLIHMPFSFTTLFRELIFRSKSPLADALEVNHLRGTRGEFFPLLNKPNLIDQFCSMTRDVSLISNKILSAKFIKDGDLPIGLDEGSLDLKTISGLKTSNGDTNMDVINKQIDLIERLIRPYGYSVLRMTDFKRTNFKMDDLKENTGAVDYAISDSRDTAKSTMFALAGKILNIIARYVPSLGFLKYASGGVIGATVIYNLVRRLMNGTHHYKGMYSTLSVANETLNKLFNQRIVTITFPSYKQTEAMPTSKYNKKHGTGFFWRRPRISVYVYVYKTDTLNKDTSFSNPIIMDTIKVADFRAFRKTSTSSKLENL